MKQPLSASSEPLHGAAYGTFEDIVQETLKLVDKKNLESLREDFHTRLRITLSQPETPELIEDLWNFFYDWCFFEQDLPNQLKELPAESLAKWEEFKQANHHGLFSVQKVSTELLKLKELYSGKSFSVSIVDPSISMGLHKGDILEARIRVNEREKGTDSSLIRKPSYHPETVHNYLRKKIRQFKKSKDVSTYQNWLWLLVGMYLKHRIYQQMPIEKIYDDTSRI